MCSRLFRISSRLRPVTSVTPRRSIQYQWLYIKEMIASSPIFSARMITAGSFCAGLVLLQLSAKKVAKAKYDEVYKQIKKGSRPTLQDDVHRCERSGVIQTLTETIMSTDARRGDQNVFFVVVGPVGCGKSWVVKKVCNSIPEGTIYYQICDSASFANGLASACGMPLSMGGNFWQVLGQSLLGWMGVGGTSWFELPQDDCAAVSYVFDVLEREANIVKKHTGYIPTLVLDAVNTLAKTNNMLFEHLVRTCKRVVNDGILNVVMVSSEGQVVPLVKKRSEKSRVVVHFLPDITPQEAYEVLTRRNVVPSVASKIVDITGPRLQLLYLALTYARKCGYQPGAAEVDEPKLVQCIKGHLEDKAMDNLIQAKANKSHQTFPIKKLILETVLEGSPLNVLDLEHIVQQKLLKLPKLPKSQNNNIEQTTY